MKYLILLVIFVFSFSNVKADFCDVDLLKEITAYGVHTGIEEGYDVNQDCVNEDGNPTTPLHLLVRNTHNVQALTAFILNGADLLATNSVGQTPHQALQDVVEGLYVELQQAEYRYNTMVDAEYEQAQNRINQAMQNAFLVEQITEISDAWDQIHAQWVALGRTPFEEAQARYNHAQEALRYMKFFTDAKTAMTNPAFNTYQPVTVNEEYNEERDIQEFINFVNEKLMELGLEPIQRGGPSNLPLANLRDTMDAMDILLEEQSIILRFMQLRDEYQSSFGGELSSLSFADLMERTFTLEEQSIILRIMQQSDEYQSPF